MEYTKINISYEISYLEYIMSPPNKQKPRYPMNFIFGIRNESPKIQKINIAHEISYARVSLQYCLQKN